MVLFYTDSRLYLQLMGLQIRTGAHGFCLIMPGHVNNLALPVQAFTDGTEDFFTNSLNLVISKVVALFHQWACVQHKGMQHPSLEL